MIFRNKIVLITGAASGIGACTAVKFCKEGAKVVVVDKNLNGLEKTAERCKDALVVNGDVSKDHDVREMFKKITKKFEKLDVLVNCAGIVRRGSVIDGSNFKTYDEIMDVNLRGTVHVTNLAVPYLIKAKGNIVNISSVGAKMRSFPPFSSIYNVSKAALNAFTVTTAAELGSHGVRVNAVSPGPTDTNLVANCDSSVTFDDQKKDTLLNRISTPDEIAELVLFIASDKAQGITGSNFIADNGFILNYSPSK